MIEVKGRRRVEVGEGNSLMTASEIVEKAVEKLGF